ncbi:hypothetical protein MFLAVUS_008929 [Mucor flavus]|uniref:Insertion element IS150 protein InsJ-like helix-turn-helix domain-containing protein n=1 Tax=Mucor flavus TaxID=439312 RepID=A0ABP9Z8I6_9FUNG
MSQQSTFWRVCDKFDTCHCDWRYTIHDCEEEDVAKVIYWIVAVVCGIFIFVTAALLYFRLIRKKQKIVELKNGFLRPRPLESLIFCGFSNRVVYNTWSKYQTWIDILCSAAIVLPIFTATPWGVAAGVYASRAISLIIKPEIFNQLRALTSDSDTSSGSGTHNASKKQGSFEISYRMTDHTRANPFVPSSVSISIDETTRISFQDSKSNIASVDLAAFGSEQHLTQVEEEQLAYNAVISRVRTPTPVHNSPGVAKPLSDGIHKDCSDQAREIFIDRMIEGPLERGKVTSHAKNLGINPRTAMRWWKHYQETGEVAYKKLKRAGDIIIEEPTIEYIDVGKIADVEKNKPVAKGTITAHFSEFMNELLDIMDMDQSLMGSYPCNG